MSELTLRNRQQRRPLDLRVLRRIAENVLRECLGNRPYEIGLQIVAAAEMSRINERHLQHSGSTDVITFPYTAPNGAHPLLGDIFICMDDAIRQARRFRTSWQAELARYFIHGVLHLTGRDDLQSSARREMKREENRLLRMLKERFRLSALARKSRGRIRVDTTCSTSGATKLKMLRTRPPACECHEAPRESAAPMQDA